MSKIFLVNVGANTSDRSRARSPVFKGGRFIYVPFSFKRRGNDGFKDYPARTRPFIRTMHGRSTHCDPDWDNYTYGDNCLNRRARALATARAGDILLFGGCSGATQLRVGMALRARKAGTFSARF